MDVWKWQFQTGIRFTSSVLCNWSLWASNICHTVCIRFIRTCSYFRMTFVEFMQRFLHIMDLGYMQMPGTVLAFQNVQRALWVWGNISIRIYILSTCLLYAACQNIVQNALSSYLTSKKTEITWYGTKGTKWTKKRGLKECLLQKKKKKVNLSLNLPTGGSQNWEAHPLNWVAFSVLRERRAPGNLGRLLYPGYPGHFTVRAPFSLSGLVVDFGKWTDEWPLSFLNNVELVCFWAVTKAR